MNPMTRYSGLAMAAAMLLLVSGPLGCDSSGGGSGNKTDGTVTTDTGADAIDGAQEDATTTNDATPSETVEDTTQPTTCTSDADCTATSACTTGVCNTGTGKCQYGDLPDGTPCDSGNACVEDETCTGGSCAGGTPVAPDCVGRECGQDACGNSCGTCGAGEQCNDGTCEGGTEACNGMTYEGCCTADHVLQWCENGAVESLDCGAEASLCGWWADQGFYACMDTSEEEPTGEHPYYCPGECDTPCDGRVCGTHCGQECGACEGGQYCTTAGQCEACSCEGKECGDDGCGNSCGTCEGDAQCNADGQCTVDPCSFTTYVGCCDGATLYYCDGGAPTIQDCAAQGCGWDGNNGWYECGFAGADPTGTNPIECFASNPDIGPETSEEVIVEEATVEEAMVEEAMVEEAMVEEAMVEEAMVEEAMVEETASAETMVEESPDAGGSDATGETTGDIGPGETSSDGAGDTGTAETSAD